MVTKEMAPVGVIERDIRIRPPEAFVEGEHPPLFAYPDEVVKLSQIRPGQNVILQDLKDNIEVNGLLNPPDAAEISPELLAEYIAFTNHVWKDQATIEDFDHIRLPNGNYILIVAGMTRYEAILQLQAESKRPHNMIQFKEHHVTSIQDILSIQQGENTHSTPPIERVAQVSVEHYLWGQANGQWSNIAEFCRSQNYDAKESKLVFNAILFSELPQTYRDLVFNKKIPFTAGVELARSARVIKKCLSLEQTGGAYDDIDDEELRQKVDELLHLEMSVKTMHIMNDGLNSTAVVKQQRGWRQYWRDRMIPPSEEEMVNQLDGLFIDPRSELDREIREAKHQIKIFLQKHSHKPSSSALEFIQLWLPAVDETDQEEILSDYAQSAETARKLVGSVGLQATMLAVT